MSFFSGSAQSRLWWWAALALCAGCAATPPAIVHQPMTARTPADIAPRQANGAIYQAGAPQRPLFEDRRARSVGDTLIVLISEANTASKKSNSNVERKGSATANVTALDKVPGRGFVGLNVAGQSENTFDGGGAASANNAFTGTIAVTVTEVLPNGNLLVSGEKQIAMTQGTEFVRFSGIVNPRTILANNSVSSTQVADARIEYKANGYIDEAQVMGWLARFFLTFLPF
jgi:flagellar L-ring protein FlgH